MESESVWRILTVLIAILTGVNGWFARAYFRLNDRVVRAETLIEERNKTVDSSILDLKDMLKATEKRYTELSSKLEILSRIDETMKHLDRICTNIVPREEYELIKEVLEKRLDDVEDQIRP